MSGYSSLAGSDFRVITFLIRRGRVLRTVLYREGKLVLGIPAVLISFDVLLDKTLLVQYT